MEEKILRVTALKSIVLMICVMLASMGFTDYSDISVYADEAEGEFDFSTYAALSNRIFLEGLDEQLKETEKEKTGLFKEGEDTFRYLGENYIAIEKGTDNPLGVSLEDLYMTKSIVLTINDLEEKNITYQSVARIKDGSEFKGIPIENNVRDLVRALDISYLYNTGNYTYSAILKLNLDHIYAYRVYEDEKNIYVDLRKPSEEYEKIVVIDPGHGGYSIGTYSDGMKHLEKDINLSVSLYLKNLLDKEDIKVYYTRLTDENVYLNPRKDLANELKADLFLSIHCNGNTETEAYGLEVLYNEKDPLKQMYSRKLAEICLEDLVKTTGLRNRGIKGRSDVYIIGTSQVPVALIEMGFITNESDLDYLLKNENRIKIAESLHRSIMKALETDTIY